MNNEKTAKSKNVNVRYLIHATIAISLMIFFRFVPPFGQMTTFGMEILGIFLGALWGWIKCDMIWPSVLAFIFLGFSQYADSATAALAAAFGNQLVQLILWLLVFSAILTVSGISEQIAKQLITSKLTKGKPWILSILILLAVFIASAFGAAFAGILICWEFVYMISKQVGYSKEDTWPKMMIVGIVFTSTIGSVLMPFTVGVVASFGYLTSASEGLYGTYSYGAYFIFSIIFSISIMAIYMLMNKFIVRPDMTKLKEAQVDVGTIEPYNTKQKLALGALVALVVVTILPSLLPAAIQVYINTLGTSILVLSITVIMTLFKDENGKPYYTFQELANAGIFWNMIFMVATAITMGTALASADTGFNATFISVFMPIFSGMNPYMFSLIVCIATIILTNFINNAVAGAIMVPIMYSFATAIGANPLLITALIIFCSDVGILLPSSSPFGAMLAGNKEWVKPKELFFLGTLAIVATILAVAVVGIPIGNLIIK